MNKVTRIVVILLSSIAILLVLITVIGFWPGSTKNIESIANRFQPDPSWALESETINPPQVICLQADCDKVRKIWTLEKPLTNSMDFIVFTKKIEEDISHSDNCIDANLKNNSTPFCEVSGTIEDYQVSLTYSHYEDSKPRIILNIERHP